MKRIILILMMVAGCWTAWCQTIYSAALERKALAGQAQAQHDLGVAYFYGNGVEADQEKAAEWFAKSAAQNHPDGTYNYGVCLINGYGVPTDYLDGLDYLWQAHRLGVKDAMEVINSICSGSEEDWGNYNMEPFEYSGIPDTEEIAAAEDKLKAVADASPSACYYLAVLCRDRNDFAGEYKYLTRAHDLYYPDGKTFDYKADRINPLDGGAADYAIEAYVQDFLGYYHEFGIGGCPKDPAKAIEYYETSETRDGMAGTPGAWVPMVRTALCYKKIGDMANYIKTLEERQYSESHNAWGGSPWATLWLAEAYFKGDGVARDYRKAYKLFDRLTEVEIWNEPLAVSFPDIYADACWRIYQILDGGLGVERDAREARLYFQEAVKHGSAPALAAYRQELVRG